jgi:hypothetical protein
MKSLRPEAGAHTRHTIQTYYCGLLCPRQRQAYRRVVKSVDQSTCLIPAVLLILFTRTQRRSLEGTLCPPLCHSTLSTSCTQKLRIHWPLQEVMPTGILAPHCYINTSQLVTKSCALKLSIVAHITMISESSTFVPLVLFTVDFLWKFTS